MHIHLCRMYIVDNSFSRVPSLLTGQKHLDNSRWRKWSILASILYNVQTEVRVSNYFTKFITQGHYTEWKILLKLYDAIQFTSVYWNLTFLFCRFISGVFKKHIVITAYAFYEHVWIPNIITIYPYIQHDK